MKKRFLTLILIVITIVQVLAPFSVGYDKKKTIEITPNKVEAATNCSITKVLFNPITNEPDRRPNDVSLLMNTTGCIGKFIANLHIDAAGAGTNAGTTVLKVDRATITNDNPTFSLKTGEKSCSGKACNNIVVSFSIIDNITGSILSSYVSNREDNGDRMFYYCTGENGDLPGTDNDCSPKEWEFISSTGIDQVAAAQTTVSMYYYEITTATETTTSKNFPTKTECDASREQAIANATMGGSSNAMVGECVEKQVTQTTVGTNSNNNQNENGADILPSCSLNPLWDGGGTVMGCVAQIFYYVLFVPTSYIFALAGTFFDFTFHYSIQDESYKTPFVVEGWGIVRDMCNMFFIFVLLYIAFGTILNLHSVKTKEMIINVVIIGLLINFSLFATQVIIDASNILARVFYNSDSIKITQTDNAANGVANTTPGLKIGPNGEIPLSAAIVNKVNPQNLIINGTKAVVIKDNVQKKQTSAADDKQSNLGVGAFILITLLATAVNIVGLIVFLSVGLIFVARVIGLWFAMILSPFVFFSYTVPSLQDMEMVGWKKWWPETLKLAFLAPVFIFFMYLIIAFLEKGLSLVSANDASDGMSFVISVIVPFIFIMILLMKAKDIAKDMSGKLGQSITNGIAAVGGIALGGAALGAAALGRGTIGAVSKFTQNDGARQNALKFKGFTDQWSQMNKLNPFSYFKLAGRGVSGLGKAATALPAAGFSMIGRKTDPHTGKTTNAFQRETAKLADKEHASHILDEKAQGVTGNKEAKYKDLTEDEQKKVHNVIDRDIASKEQYNKVYDKLDSTQRAALDGYRNPADPRGDWAGAAEMNKTIAAGRGEHIHTAEELSKNSKEPIAVSEFVNALRKGSYDIRNISKLQSSSKGMAKAGIGMAAVIASGVRMGLKNGVGVEHGTGQKDLFKDLGNVISESLKGVKLDIPKAPPSGGGHSGGDSHGSGGHH